MRYFAFLILPIFLFISNVYAQPKSAQSWQQATIATDAITISCRPLLLPYELGRLLFEGAPTTVEGEMDSTLRSAHSVKVLLQPQTGTSDTLSAINGCTIDGAVVQLGTADTGDTITIANSSTIKFGNAQPYVLSSVNQIVTLIRKGGVWVAATMGGSDSQIEIANNCAHATAFDQLCIDRVQHRLYLGTGVGIVSIGGTGGGDGGGCFGLDECFDLGPTIDGLDGRTNALRLLDSNGDGFLIYVGTSGPVIECVTDFGTVNEAACAPTERKAIGLSPANFSPDGTYFVHSFNVALNSGRVPVALNPGDNDSAGIETSIAMPDSWDGAYIRVRAWLHTAEATPAGEILLYWTGYCVSGQAPGGTGSYPAEAAGGAMQFDIDGLSQHYQQHRLTALLVPLSGCAGTTDRILWLRAMIDAAGTTADNLSQQHLFNFMVLYGLSSFD